MRSSSGPGGGNDSGSLGLGPIFLCARYSCRKVEQERMRRAVVCVATTERYRRGMYRLLQALQPGISIPPTPEWWGWGEIPSDWPSHEQKPYAFKAYAMKHAADAGAEVLLWCDACILPIRSMEPLWEKIETEGYWICRNGWTNYEWTADSAYMDLFPGFYRADLGLDMTTARVQNKQIPHVVATSFGLNLRSDIGKAFLDEYFRLASETNAFCGPWKNTPETPCGPEDVLGHRHDQTAASVIAWRLGMKLTDPPAIFAYPPGDERTILLADGSYQ